jgi:hypothetical protein
MHVLIVSPSDGDELEVVQRGLTSEGHGVTAALGDGPAPPIPGDTDLVLAVSPAPGVVEDRLLATLEDCRRRGVPLLAVTLGRRDGEAAAPDGLAADEWLAVEDPAQVLDAVRARIPAQAGPQAPAAATRAALPARRRAEHLRQTAARVRDRAHEVSTSEPVALVGQRLRATVGRSRGAQPDERVEPARCSVFVSYSSQDSRAKDVVTELERLGFRVWVDTSSIKGAEDYRISIERGIRAADAFVLLLSPNVARDPAWVRLELNAAQSAGKKIVPVRLRRTNRLPDGFELVLEGLQRVDLYPSFARGLEQLAEVLGAVDVQPSGALTARVRRRVGQARHLALDHDLAGKAKVAGGAAVAGAGLAFAVAVKALAEQEQRHEAERTRQQDQALEDYVTRTVRLLTDGMEEVQLSTGPSADDYRNDFRPAYLTILGELKGSRPPRADLQPRHDRLVEELRKLLDELDQASRKADEGDLQGYQRAITRCDRQWSKLVVSSVEWLQSVQ